MRKAIQSLVVILCLVSSVIAQPKMEFSHDLFNFGKGIQKAVYTHDFWIKSVGTEPLLITHVEPGCGCTESWLSDTLIAPGDSARLHIVFSSGRFRGNVGKRPYITTNADDEKHYLKIYANLEIKPEESMPVRINPTTVDVSQFDDRPRQKASFQIENRSDNDLNLKVVDSSYKSFTIKIPTTIKAGESIKAVVTVKEDFLPYGFEESITIRFDDIEGSIYSIPIRRMIKGKVLKAPPK